MSTGLVSNVVLICESDEAGVVSLIVFSTSGIDSGVVVALDGSALSRLPIIILFLLIK